MPTDTHYATLGVAPTATQSEIKNAFRELARKLHPDSGPGHEAQFRAVAEAYGVLRSEDQRRLYDRELAERASPTLPDTPPGQGPLSSAQPSRPDGHANPTPGYTYTPAGQRASGSQTPFGYAYSAGPWTEAGSRLDNQQRIGWQTSGRRGRKPAGTAIPPLPRRRVRGYFARPRGARVRLWVFPLVFIAVAVALRLQIGGVAAALFHAHPGMPLTFGTWTGNPGWGDGLIPEYSKALWQIGLFAAAVTAGYAWRKTIAPTPRAEPLALLAALFVVVASGQFLFSTTSAKMVLVGLGAAYALWLYTLRRLPRPADDTQWASFRLWMAGVAGYYRQKKARATSSNRSRQSWRTHTR